MQKPSTWITIDSKAFDHNISQYKSFLDDNVIFAPVIKSNAYGHGITQIAQLCQKNINVNYICVVSLSEALLLREIGIKKPILVLSIIDRNLELAILHDIEVVMYEHELLKELVCKAKEFKKPAYIHIKIDTGLSRLGLRADKILDSIKFFTDFIEPLKNQNFVIIKGIFSHFAESELPESPFTDYQIEQFNKILSHIKKLDINPKIIHSTCSAATATYKKSHFNFVRAGIGIYGLWPSKENRLQTLKMCPEIKLKPVLSWKTQIIQIKEIPADSHVGYDRTYKVNRPTTIAVLPIGYWDGYDRRLSNKAHVAIDGQLAPIIGRIAMNLTVIDITNIQDIWCYKEVSLIGNIDKTKTDDLADLCNTINYELITRINPLIPRIII